MKKLVEHSIDLKTFLVCGHMSVARLLIKSSVFIVRMINNRKYIVTSLDGIYSLKPKKTRRIWIICHWDNMYLPTNYSRLLLTYRRLSHSNVANSCNRVGHGRCVKYHSALLDVVLSLSPTFLSSSLSQIVTLPGRRTPCTTFTKSRSIFKNLFCLLGVGSSTDMISPLYKLCRFRA